MSYLPERSGRSREVQEGAEQISRFSYQQGFQPLPSLLAYEDMPEEVRHEIFYLIRYVKPSDRQPSIFYDKLRHVLRPFERRHGSHLTTESADFNPTLASTRMLLEFKTEWYEVLDLCQEIHSIFQDVYGSEISGVWNSELNKAFAEAGLMWRAVGSDFEKVMDEVTAGSIQAAKNILVEPRFEAPSEQFGIAVSQYHERPTPNLKDCITNAINALEGVARIITGQESMLSTLLQGSLLREKIHPTLLESLSKLYAYRGSVTAHGQTGEQDQWCDIEEAEWVLGMCATSMVYLANKFPPPIS